MFKKGFADSTAVSVLWLIVVIGLLGFLIMLLIEAKSTLSPLFRAALVALALTIVISPVVYLHIRGRKRTKETLKESEERYRALFESAREGIITSGHDGQILLANPAAVALLGYQDPAELVGRPAIELYADSEQRKLLFEELMEKGHIENREVTFKKKDGTPVYILASAVVHKDREGNIRQTEGMFMDITERKQMQEGLLAAERLVTLGQFSGNISHELRNPLSVIGSSAYYLKTRLKDADERVQEHLNRIQLSVDNANAIIQSLLDLTRMREAQLAKLNLVTITAEAIATAKVPVGVRVIENYPEVEVLVKADGEQLTMAFRNILVNAVEAMADKGALTVTVRTENTQAEVAFADTGPGIAPENLASVFQPLFTTKARGIGFGLSITKMIIERHGGEIEAKSELGKGATFLIHLPTYVDKSEGGNDGA